MRDFLATRAKIFYIINSVRYLHNANLKFDFLFCNFNILEGRLFNKFIQE